jgi:hypothetical protein
VEYRDYYGPPYRRARPEKDRCAESVTSDGWGGHQCSRKATHDPDAQGNPTTCKQHSEYAVSSRRAKQKAAYDIETARWKLRSMALPMKTALEAIAKGHNDPRSLAAEVLERFNK